MQTMKELKLVDLEYAILYINDSNLLLLGERKLQSLEISCE